MVFNISHATSPHHFHTSTFIYIGLFDVTFRWKSKNKPLLMELPINFNGSSIDICWAWAEEFLSWFLKQQQQQLFCCPSKETCHVAPLTRFQRTVRSEIALLLPTFPNLWGRENCVLFFTLNFIMQLYMVINPKNKKQHPFSLWKLDTSPQDIIIPMSMRRSQWNSKLSMRVVNVSSWVSIVEWVSLASKWQPVYTCPI